MTRLKESYDPNKHLIVSKPNCPKCYGRGYVGTNLTTGQKQLCKCLRLAYKPIPEEEPVTIVQPDEPEDLPVERPYE